MPLKLSIIIPVYNVESYISRCLDSLLLQDLSRDEYEIIVVNDETPDNSMRIVREYQLNHNNIHIADRKNGGLSAARNTGLELAKGKYVWFVDSDDRIEPNCLGRLINQLEEDSLDVLCFNLNIEYESLRIEKYCIFHDGNCKLHNGKDFITSVLMPPAAWAAIYRRDYLNTYSLRFYPGILHEDQEFTPRAYALAGRIEYLDTHIYYYNQREGGIMKSNRNEKRCRDLLTVADSLYSFANKNFNKNEPVHDELMRKVYFNISQSLAFHSEKALSINEYRNRPYFPFRTDIVNGTMKLKLILANFSPRLYSFIYKFFKKW